MSAELMDLRSQLGLSVDQFAEEMEIDRRTLDAHLSNPSKKMNRPTRRKMHAVRRRLQKTLVSEVGNIILESYRQHKDKQLFPSDRDLLQFIDDHLVILKRLQPACNFEKGEFTYLEAHFHYSRAFHGKWGQAVSGEARRESATKALHIYSEAAKILKSIKAKTLTEDQAAYRAPLIELFELNAIETKWQMAKQRYVNRKEAFEWLREKDVLNRLRKAMDINPRVWTIPHNGLIFASQFNDRDSMKLFYDKLVEVQPGFKSWDFTPGETPTIKKDNDLEAFRKAFAHLDNSGK